jgi:hypothetical protein
MKNTTFFFKNSNLRVSQKHFIKRGIVARYFVLVIICMMLASIAFSQATTTTITHDQAVASLKTNRDRLLTSYATRLGYQDAAQAWSYMSTSQKGVFLTLTDYLGRRLFAHLNNNYEIRYVGDQSDSYYGCAYRNSQPSPYPYPYNEYLWVHPINYPDSCRLVSPSECVTMSKCSRNQLPRTDYDMILNHVSTLYAVNGSNGSNCGGMEYNRVFFQADDELIYLLRNPWAGVPGLDNSQDLAGPHNPFTQSREGIEGQPRGQTQQWAWDYEATTLTRNGVYGIYDPHIVEMDIDYDFFHHSNPECYYDGTYGRNAYENFWYFRGLGGYAELDYSPSI